MDDKETAATPATPGSRPAARRQALRNITNLPRRPTADTVPQQRVFEGRSGGTAAARTLPSALGSAPQRRGAATLDRISMLPNDRNPSSQEQHDSEGSEATKTDEDRSEVLDVTRPTDGLNAPQNPPVSPISPPILDPSDFNPDPPVIVSDDSAVGDLPLDDPVVPMPHE